MYNEANQFNINENETTLIKIDNLLIPAAVCVRGCIICKGFTRNALQFTVQSRDGSIRNMTRIEIV